MNLQVLLLKRTMNSGFESGYLWERNKNGLKLLRRKFWSLSSRAIPPSAEKVCQFPILFALRRLKYLLPIWSTS